VNIPAYDILKQIDGHVIWVQAVPDLDTANACIKEFQESFGGQYVIFDQHTQQVVATSHR
jgi:hypothetical protein